jgi:LRR receptor-like serine/threonine-protein kinase FLS2
VPLAVIIIVFVMILRRHYVQPLREAKRMLIDQHTLFQISRKQVETLERTWEILPDQLRFEARIDGDSPGSFGEVYRGTYLDRPVAIKKLQRLHLDGGTPDAVADFEREMSFLRSLHHGNIVYFFGAGYEVSYQNSIRVPFLVTELMGALESCVFIWNRC